MAEAAEQPIRKEKFSFKGKQLECKTQFFDKDVFLYGGYWKRKANGNSISAEKNPVGSKVPQLKKEVAIRAVKYDQCVDRWRSVADQLINLKHNNILQVFGYEEDVAKGLRYFALEVYSATLYHYCTGQYKGPAPNETQVLYQITAGINYLHDKLIIHGNLSPLSIVIAAQSRPVRMKISNFGFSIFSFAEVYPLHNGNPSICESLQLCQRQYWTLRGEMNVKEKQVDDDVVAAGCILFYYLMDGKHLFGDDSASILNNLKKKNLFNFKKLSKKHAAYEPIKNMILPPQNGFHWLRIAKERFQEALSLKVDTNNRLGSGTFGHVYQGKFNGDPVAVKQMTTTTSEKKTIQREMSKHIELNHVNVVKLWDVSDSADNIFTHLVLELCAGTLTDYCENKYCGPELPPDELVLYQIANGLHYIHSRDLVHRDIKPDNILISMTTPVQMKVSDLSFVKKTRQDLFSQSKIRGTIQWMAPEALKILNDPSNMSATLPDGTITSDTFSSGCVFFYFLTRGLHPFGNNVTAPANILESKPVEFVNYMKKPAKENKIGRILAAVIERMINAKAEERMDLADVIKQLITLLSRMGKIQCQLRHVEIAVERLHSNFHPTEAILACANRQGLILYTSENSSIPFSNWRKQIKYLPRNLCVKDENVRALEWNMNGTQLAVGYNDGTLVVWNYPQLKILLQKKYSSYSVYGIEWSPARTNVLATFDALRKRVLLWDSSIGDVSTTIDCDNNVRAVKWISENRIAVSSNDDMIRIFKMDESHLITTTRIVKKFIHKGDYTFKLESNERTQYLASCGGNEIKIWSMDKGMPIYSIKTEKDIRTLAWRPCVIRNAEEVGGIDVARESVENLTFVYSLRSFRLFIWNPLENEQKPRLLYDKDDILSIAFSSDGRFLAGGGRDKVIIWSAEDWKPICNCEYLGVGNGFSWLCSSTSTNIYENKLINKLSYNETNLFEFAFHESNISDSASEKSIEPEEESLILSAASETSIEPEEETLIFSAASETSIEPEEESLIFSDAESETSEILRRRTFRSNYSTFEPFNTLRHRAVITNVRNNRRRRLQRKTGCCSLI